MPIRPSDVRHYAVAGAQTRLETLRAEVAMLRRTFPELEGGRSASRDTSDRPAPKTSRTGRKRGRAPMTAAQRKAVGERMAKYWAKRRKEKTGKGANAKALKVAKERS